MTFLEGETPAAPRTLRLADYVAHVERFPESRDSCVEYATPEHLHTLFPRPDYCKLRDESDVVSATFVANGGNYNHLHFDDDQRDVLLYQVFGTKRFVVISPDQARKLDAFLVFDRGKAEALAAIPSRDANGRVFLENFPSEAARNAFLRYVHASDALVHPGETIFPVWIAVRPNSRTLSLSQGKGLDPWAARVSATMEYIELALAERPSLTLEFATEQALASRETVVDIRALPRPKVSLFGARRPVHWTRVADWATGAAIWVPYELVNADATVPWLPGSGSFLPSTNGLASGIRDSRPFITGFAR
jgi:hypothetical protein